MAVSSTGQAINSSYSLHIPLLCSPTERRQQFRVMTIPKICRIEKLKSNRRYPIPTVRAMSPMSLDFKGTFFEGGGGDDNGLGSVPLEEFGEEKSRECPPGLRDYETMAVLRPDVSEEERLALTQRYEEVSHSHPSQTIHISLWNYDQLFVLNFSIRSVWANSLFSVYSLIYFLFSVIK